VIDRLGEQCRAEMRGVALPDRDRGSNDRDPVVARDIAGRQVLVVDPIPIGDLTPDPMPLRGQAYAADAG